MDEIALARHGESEASALGIVGGDAPLTDRGRTQAQALARKIEGLALEICLTSEARRALETASIALADHDVPVEVVPEFRDAAFGAFEGRPLAEYRDWIARHPPDANPPGGGESRVATLRRFAFAFRCVLARRARLVFIVAHGLTLSAVVDPQPRPGVADLPYGTLARLRRAELEQAVAQLERWCDAPAW
jgi:uncharacterized phosphatase